MVNIARTAARTTSRLPKRALRRIAGDPLEIDGNTLDLQTQVVAAAAARQASGDVPTPDELRDGFRDLVDATAHDAVAEVSVHDRVIAGPGGELPVRLYHPPSADGAAPAIVWFHQGGFVIGDLDTDHAFCSTLSDRCGAVVMSVDYRLAPEHGFPAWIDDGMTGYQWLIDHAEGVGIDPTRVAVAGTSAGATLSTVICQQLRQRGLPQPIAQVLLYGGFDATAETGSRISCAATFPLGAPQLAFFTSHNLPNPAAAADLRMSPGLSDELWGLAPAVVITAGFDPLRDEGDRYAAALAAAGVDVVHRVEHDLTHSFTVFGGVSKEARNAIARAADDIAAALGVD